MSASDGPSPRPALCCLPPQYQTMNPDPDCDGIQNLQKSTNRAPAPLPPPLGYGYTSCCCSYTNQHPATSVTSANNTPSSPPPPDPVQNSDKDPKRAEAHRGYDHKHKDCQRDLPQLGKLMDVHPSLAHVVMERHVGCGRHRFLAQCHGGFDRCMRRVGCDGRRRLGPHGRRGSHGRRDQRG